MSDEIEQLHKKIAYLTEQAERWEDDALRLMKERNEALGEIELLRSTVTDCRIEIEKLRNERDEARRLLKAVVDMMRDNMAPDATHPKHVCDFIYCPEIATCMVCENWTDAMVMCYPDDFQDEEETK